MGRLKILMIFIVSFTIIYFMPFERVQIQNAILEAFLMLQYYAREHVLFCLIPAFFVAGAIANFVSQQAVLKYFGGKAKKWVSYSVASVSGTILAVCSCTVLPLFSGIYRQGAGIGPATAFLYSGPAINILAIILTARVLGWEMGLARAVGAIIFAIIIGLIMSAIYAREDQERISSMDLSAMGEEEQPRSPQQNILYFFTLILILIFAAWGKPETVDGFWLAIYNYKWPVTFILLLILALMLYRWFKKDELVSWIDSTWNFAQQILPLLFAGVFIAGFLMGRPGTEAGLIPSDWVAAAVGGNSLQANFLASILGALMYFATLTEVPILQGLLGLGMGHGPALAMLLAGPALSLPNMLVIHSVLGTRKTLTFILLVVIVATFAGMVYGNIIT